MFLTARTLAEEVAHWMALIPLAVLGLLALRGQPRDPAWWWLGAACAVSWLADTAAHWVSPTAVSVLYPVTQGAIVVAVLRSREDAGELLGVLVAAASASILLGGLDSPDIIVRSLAWLPAVWIAATTRPLPARLRAALVVYFGLGWATWLVHVHWLVVATWWPYQGARLAGVLLLASAIVTPRPHVRLLRRARVGDTRLVMRSF